MNDITTTNNTTDEPRESVGFSSGEAALALEELLPQLEALPESELSYPRVPISVAVARGYRILQYAREDAPLFADTFRRFDPALIDHFELAIQALWLADDQWLTATDTSREGFDELVALCRTTRNQLLLLCDAAFYAHPAIADKVSEIRQGSGYRDLADDLRKLVALIRANQPIFQQQIHLADPQLERASRLGDNLIRLLETQSVSATAALQTQRLRAFAYFAKLYIEIFRYGTYQFADLPRGTRYISLYADLPHRSRTRSDSSSGSSSPEPGDTMNDSPAPESGPDASAPIAAPDAETSATA